jgi:hypothetical protein
MMKRMIRKIAALAAAALYCSAGHCIDGVALEYGRGDDRTNLLRIALIDKWRKRQEHNPQNWRLAGYWDFSFALWDNAEESTADLGFTPVFRIEKHQYYLEGAFGFHLVQTHISAHRVFSTAFQFAEHVGAGIRAGKYVYGLHAQHLSNGGVRSPNPGINFLLLRVQYELE